MIEKFGDIWMAECDWLCITTNGVIRNDGKAVMGRGIALQAKQRFPGIDDILAKRLLEKGNIVSSLLKVNNKLIIAFPTKNHWKDPSDIGLIKSSAMQLKKHFDDEKIKPIVAIPRPGCSNGGLNWDEVKNVIGSILIDNNFEIYHNE